MQIKSRLSKYLHVMQNVHVPLFPAPPCSFTGCILHFTMAISTFVGYCQLFKFSFRCFCVIDAFSALTLFVEHQEEPPVCKDWVLRCWCGYLCGVRCRLFAMVQLMPHTHPFNGPFSGTTQLGQYQKSKTSLDFTEAREWVTVASAGPYASLHLAPDI